MGWQQDPKHVHYLYVNGTVTKMEDNFVHTAREVHTELDHMKTLHKTGYTRAAVVQTQTLQTELVQVTYQKNQPDMAARAPRSKKPNTWPLQNIPHVPGFLINLDQLPHGSDPHGRYLPLEIELVKTFFGSFKNALCPWHDHISLPETSKGALQATPTAEVDEHTWSQFDRLIVYVDSSSQGHLRRKAPLWVEEFADTDAWALKSPARHRG